MMRRRSRRSSPGAAHRAELRRSAASCSDWIRTAVGGDAATVRMAVPDASGRLHVIAHQGQHDRSGRLRSSRRRAVFLTGTPIHRPIPGSDGLAIGILPIANGGGHPLGVVEIVAPADKVIGREDVLSALVGQTSLVLSVVGVRAESERTVEEMAVISRLASEMMRATTAAEAVRVAVACCFEHVGSPLAGLLPDRDGWGWFLAASGGLGTRKRTELRAALLAPDAELTPRRSRISTISKRFQEVVGSRDVVVIRARGAVLLVGDDVAEGHQRFLDRAASLLASALSELGDGRSRRKNRARDLGIALIAHELKSPLVGMRAAIERAHETHAGPEGRELLRKANDELRHLAELIDPLLQWSIGSDTLERRPVDLVEVVRDSMGTSSLAAYAHRLSIEAEDHPIVLADASQLRGAIANVVRNSFLYSPPDSPVKVRVGAEDGSAHVEVRDRGPGIPPQERGVVFDLFERGSAGRTAGAGVGLGLFIARRVLEAHGGTISLRRTRSGAAFRLELPLLKRGSQRCAS